MAKEIEGLGPIAGPGERQRDCLHEMPRPGKAMGDVSHRSVRIGGLVERRGSVLDRQGHALNALERGRELPDCKSR